MTFYGVCTSTAGDLQLVFELCATGSMRSLLQSSAELAWDQRLQFATDIAKGMKYLHGLDLVHRDIKSDNVLISDSGSGATRSPRPHYSQAAHETSEAPSLELPPGMARIYQLHAKVNCELDMNIVSCFRTLPANWRSAVITFPGNTLPNDLAPLAGAGSRRWPTLGNRDSSTRPGHIQRRLAVAAQSLAPASSPLPPRRCGDRCQCVTFPTTCGWRLYRC